MKRTTINPWTWNEAFGYSQAAVVEGSHQVTYVAGQTAIDADGDVVHAGDMAGQVRQAMDNLETVLGAAGQTLADVVRLDIYTTDLDAYFPVSSIVNDRFGSHGNIPVGGVLAQVSRLALPPLMVELVATAVR